MTIIFDGKAFAEKKEQTIKSKVQKLKEKGIKLKLVSILVGDDPASILYTKLKKKASERVGIEFEIIRFGSDESTRLPVGQVHRIKKVIFQLNKDSNVHGIMVQLPLPEKLKFNTREVIEAITPEKDVDGMREDSKFVPATVKAVLEILKVAKVDKALPAVRQVDKVAVVGSDGMVGKPLVKELKGMNYDVFEVDKKSKKFSDEAMKQFSDADVLVSAAGVPNLIKPDMVKDGAVVIDAGSPKGDVDPSTALRARFFTPVPGGVGPVTVISLLENLVLGVEKISFKK